MSPNQQLEKLQLAMCQTKSKRLFERYQAVFLHLKGYTNVEIATIIQRNQATVGIYINTYKHEGLSGLQIGKSTGKPPYLSQEQQEILSETIGTKIPADVGFIAKCNWTLSILVQWVEREWAVTYTNAGMSVLLKRLGFSHTRPTYTLEMADPKKQELFITETFPALKKMLHEEIDHILFEDESMIRDYQAIQKNMVSERETADYPHLWEAPRCKIVGYIKL